LYHNNKLTYGAINAGDVNRKYYCLLNAPFVVSAELSYYVSGRLFRNAMSQVQARPAGEYKTIETGGDAE